MTAELAPFFTTGVGRIVGGSVFDGTSTNMEGEPLKKRDGTLRTEYFIRVAFPKTDPKISYE